MYRIEIGHNVEMAHRLSTENSPLKCQSIHGHSWWVSVEISAEAPDEDGIVVEFGAFKKAWRRWLDDHLDHALVLHAEDPLFSHLKDFPAPLRLYTLHANPTTEILAAHLAERAAAILSDVVAEGHPARVTRVHLQETRVNAASWESSGRL